MSFGLMDYGGGTRFYSPLLGRFTSADTIVPGAGNPQALNRYAYTFNNPLRFTDPTGHSPECDDTPDACTQNPNWIKDYCAGDGGSSGWYGTCEQGMIGIWAQQHANYDPMSDPNLDPLLAKDTMRAYAQIAIDTGDEQRAKRFLEGVAGVSPEEVLSTAAVIAGTQGPSAIRTMKGLLQAFEAKFGAASVHGFRRHGSGTTLAQQQYRAKTGVTPDGVQGAPTDSTRFFNNGDLYDVKCAPKIGHVAKRENG